MIVVENWYLENDLEYIVLLLLREELKGEETIFLCLWTLNFKLEEALEIASE